jgi:nucleoside-diphosphate-sugar epimerase
MNPCSKKGEARAQVEQMILDEVQKGTLTAIIARAADFYGPGAVLSFIDFTVFQNLAKGKTPQLMVTDITKHSFTFTPDAARATAALGNTASAYNQIWHLPTDPNTLTGREFVELATEAFGAKYKLSLLPKFMIRILGLFIPALGESVEMLYQNAYDYQFDSSKYLKHFKHEATPYAEGIKQTAVYLQQQKK